MPSSNGKHGRARERVLRVLAAPALLLALTACAEFEADRLGDLLGRRGAPPDEATAASGLREALRVGAERAVRRLSARDGFWGDPRLRIPIPDEMRGTARTLRRLGLDRRVDELELAINRAAEQSAAEALDLFRQAIAGLTIEDAFAILRGGGSAATDLLRARTGDSLAERMKPIVHATVGRAGLARAWRDLREQVDRLPLVEAPGVDLEAWVTSRTVDRLFSELAREERRIREDPAARTTELLRRVFARR